jgi:hypothetical protein
LVILNILYINSKSKLFELITLRDRAIHGVKNRVHRAPPPHPNPILKDKIMTATTTIRIDHAALPEQFDRSRPNAVAEAIEAALRAEGIAAEVSDVISHLKIELPTTQLAAASTVLASLQLI